MTRNEAMCLVVEEYEKAAELFPAFRSAHEGIAIIKKEYDELWDEIKKKHGDLGSHKLREEAAHLTAMGMRFLIDLL